MATIPAWPILWLLAFATAARLKLGVWPSAGQPDPKTLEWPLLRGLLLPLLLAAILAFLVSLVLGLRAGPTGRRGSRFLVTVVSFAALVAWLGFDPGGFFDWWAD
jgi:hypothetical protein